MANERLTEDIVRTHFREEDPLFKSIRLEEQWSYSRNVARLRMARFVKGLSYSANF